MVTFSVFVGGNIDLKWIDGGFRNAENVACFDLVCNPINVFIIKIYGALKLKFVHCKFSKCLTEKKVSLMSLG